MNRKETFIELNLVKTFFTIFIISIVCLFFFAFIPIVKSILISFILSYLLNPAVKYLERKNIPKLLSVITVFIGFIVFISYIVYLIKLSFPTAADWNIFFEEILQGFKNLKDIANEKFAFIEWDAILDNAILKLSNTSKLTNNIGFILENISNVTSMLIIIPFTTFFVLMDGKIFLDSILRLIPNRYYEITYTTINKVDYVFGKYMRGTLIESLIIFIFSLAGLFLIGFPLGINVIVSLVAALTNIIPYVGPFFGMLFGLLVYFFNIISPEAASPMGIEPTAFLIALIFIIIQTIDNIVLKPLFLGKSVDLHPLIVIISIIAGGSLFGFFGILLAIPFVAAVKVLTSTLFEQLSGYGMLSEKVLKIVTLFKE